MKEKQEEALQPNSKGLAIPSQQSGQSILTLGGQFSKSPYDCYDLKSFDSKAQYANRNINKCEKGGAPALEQPFTFSPITSRGGINQALLREEEQTQNNKKRVIHAEGNHIQFRVKSAVTSAAAQRQRSAFQKKATVPYVASSNNHNLSKQLHETLDHHSNRSESIEGGNSQFEGGISGLGYANKNNTSFYREEQAARRSQIARDKECSSDNAAESPYKDDCSTTGLEMNVHNTSVLCGGQSVKRKGKKSSGAKKHSGSKAKKKRTTHGSSLIAVEENQARECFPQNQQIMALPPDNYGRLQPFNPKSSVFNPIPELKSLPTQQHRKFIALQSSSSAYSHSKNSQSPHKRGTTGRSVGKNSSKKDILSCLEIQRLESNRRQVETYGGNNQAPMNIVQQLAHPSQTNIVSNIQDNLAKKPMTAKSGGTQYRRTAYQVSAERPQHHPLYKLDQSYNKQVENNEDYKDGTTPSSQVQRGGAGKRNIVAVSRGESTAVGSISKHPSGSVTQSVLSCGTATTPAIPGASQHNISKVEAYQQFQEFKRERTKVQESVPKGDDINNYKQFASPEELREIRRIVNIYSNISSLQGGEEEYLVPSNVVVDDSKFMKNLLQSAVQGNKEVSKQYIKVQQTDKKNPLVDIIQESSPTNQVISNIMRTRIESQQQQALRLKKLTEPLLSGLVIPSTSDAFFAANQTCLQNPNIGGGGELKASYENLQGMAQQYHDLLTVLKTQNEDIQVSKGKRNICSQNPSVSMSAIISSVNGYAQSGAISKYMNFEPRRASADKKSDMSICTSSQKGQTSNRNNRGDNKNIFISYFDKKKLLKEEQKSILDMSTSQLGFAAMQIRKNQLLGKSTIYPTLFQGFAQTQATSGVEETSCHTLGTQPFKKLGDSHHHIADDKPKKGTAHLSRGNHTAKINTHSTKQTLYNYGQTQATMGFQQQQQEDISDSSSSGLLEGLDQSDKVSPMKQMHSKCFNRQNTAALTSELQKTLLKQKDDSLISVQGTCITKVVLSDISGLDVNQPEFQEVDQDPENSNVLLQPVLSRQRTQKSSNNYQYQANIQNLYAGKPSSIQQQRSSVSQGTNTATGQMPKKAKNFQMTFLQSGGDKRSPIKGAHKLSGLKSKFENPLRNHKVNQVINYANEFLLETFLRPNDQPVNLDKVKYICQQFFGIKLPRNIINEPNLVKNKEFQIQVKEKILLRLYDVINSENQVSQEWFTACQQLTSKKFYVGKGNNYPLVRSILKQRWWWQLCQEGEDFEQANFIWTSWRKNELLDYLKPCNFSSPLQTSNDGKLRCYNRLEDNFHLSNKKALFFNMTQYYKQLKEDPFGVLPLTFHIEHGLRDQEFDRFKAYYQQIELEKRQKTAELEKKKRDYINQKKKKKGFNGYESLSEEDEEELLAEIGDIEGYFGIKVPKNIWILKPGENSNRGAGITVCSTMREIIAEVNSSEKADHTHIIQRYIERPLLISNRKFDIRCFGLLTSVNGYMKGYFYEDGYIRTSSTEFDLEDLGNRFIHLTNDAVQKNSEDYGKFENGNKVSYQNFQKYCDQQMPEKKINFMRDLLPQIRKIVADTFKGTFMKIDPKRRLHSFEIFGYDFMIDEDLKVYLIECNTNPCLELSCPLLARIIPAMLDSAFRIALDPLFPPRSDITAAKKNANTLPEMLPLNKFELIFDERLEGEKLREVLKGQEAFTLKIDANDECGSVKEEDDGDDEANDHQSNEVADGYAKAGTTKNKKDVLMSEDEEECC